MKKALLLFATLLALWQTAFAYSFSAIAPTGQSLYYNIIGNNAEVTFPGSTWSQAYYGFTKPTGDLLIPLSVTYNGITYSVISIGQDAFCGCSGLTSVSIPNSVTSIGGSAFYGCSGLTSVTIPTSVSLIGEFAFTSCIGLNSVTIGHGVTSIGQAAFLGCSGLDSLSIGCSVSSIGMNAFKDCSSLDAITCYAEVPPTIVYDPHYSGGVFYNVPHDIPVYVPCVSLSAYQPSWGGFSNIQCDNNLQTYYIFAQSANPTRGTVSGSGYYNSGSTATLTATPNTGYHFTQWHDGNTQNPRTITVTDYTTYIAAFAADGVQPAGTATVTATISQVSATSAHFDIVMGQHTSYYYTIFTPLSELTQNGLTTDGAIINYVIQEYGSWGRIDENWSWDNNDLTPNIAVH